MAEKGGKSLPSSRAKTRAVKPSSKKGESLKGKGAPLNGKDGGFSNGRTLQFDSSDSEDLAGSPRADVGASAKGNGKVSFETPVSKGDWGKSGKGDKAGIAGKSNAPKVLITPKFEIEAELPKNARCMIDCEAEAVLQGIQEQLVILSEDPKVKVPGSFHKGLQYAKSGSYYTNSQSARRVLETLKKHKISNDEICLIGNICPETAEELVALVPSLKPNKTRTERAITDMVSELAKLKRSK